MKKQVCSIPLFLTILLTLLISGCTGMRTAQSGQANYPAFPVTNTSDTSVGSSAGAAPHSGVSSGNPQTVANRLGDGFSTPYANQPGTGVLARDSHNPPPAAGAQPKFPLSLQLALGTLKLEGAAQAVTAEQAAKLLPLWQEAYSMSQSGENKAADLELIFTQIQAVMTSEQMATIQSMEVSSEELAALAQSLGIGLPSLDRATLTPSQLATMQASGQNGPPPGVGGPGGGNPAPLGTPPAGAAQPPAGGRGELEKAFFQAIIDLLTEKLP